MKLIGVPLDFDPCCLHIAQFFHKVALGLESGTKVYLSAVPPETPSPGTMNEVLLTTFKPNQWKNLWRLSLELKEGEGVVASVLDYLRSHVNISILETLTTESSRCHELLAIVENLEKSEEEFKQLLTAEIESRLGNRLLPGSAPRLYPMSRLQTAAKRRAMCVPPLGEKDYVPGTIEKGRILLPDGEISRLLGAPGDAVDDSDLPKKVMIFSDTEEKYLLLYFPNNGDCIMRASILHEEKQGALYSFADRLREMGVNILSSYLRLQSTGERAQWKVTMDVTRAKSCKEILAGIRGCKAFFIGYDSLSFHYVPDANRRHAPLAGNPYNYTENINSDDMLFGREREISQILTKAVMDNGQLETNYQISGYYRTGKTVLLRGLERRLAGGSGKLMPVYVDLKYATPHTHRRQILQEVGQALVKRGLGGEGRKAIERYLLTGEIPGETPESRCASR